MSDLTWEQAEWVESARALVDFLEQRPSLIPLSGIDAHPYINGKEELAAALRLLGPAEKYASELFIGARRSFGPHSVVVSDYRRNVCERVQVGTKRVTVQATSAEELPEDALSPRAREVWEYETEQPVFETRCPPSLLALGE